MKPRHDAIYTQLVKQERIPGRRPDTQAMRAGNKKPRHGPGGGAEVIHFPHGLLVGRASRLPPFRPARDRFRRVARTGTKHDAAG
jgi:hypothetical protein